MAYKNVNKDKMKKQLVPELNWVTRKRVRFAGGANVSVRLSGKGKAKEGGRTSEEGLWHNRSLRGKRGA